MPFPLVRQKHLATSRAVAARLGEELDHVTQELRRAEARIAEMMAPEVMAKRSIAEVEAKIQLAELEETLRRMKEDPDPEQSRVQRPSLDQVKKAAAESRARRVPRKT